MLVSSFWWQQSQWICNSLILWRCCTLVSIWFLSDSMDNIYILQFGKIKEEILSIEDFLQRPRRMRKYEIFSLSTSLHKLIRLTDWLYNDYILPICRWRAFAIFIPSIRPRRSSNLRFIRLSNWRSDISAISSFSEFDRRDFDPENPENIARNEDIAFFLWVGWDWETGSGEGLSTR